MVRTRQRGFRRRAGWWARAVTGHHGQPPKENDDWKQHFDRHPDCAATLAFVDEALRMFLDDEIVQAIVGLGAERFLAASIELSWWVSGLEHRPFRVLRPTRRRPMHSPTTGTTRSGRRSRRAACCPRRGTATVAFGDLLLRPSKSKGHRHPDNPVFFRAFVRTTPVPAWDAAQTR